MLKNAGKSKILPVALAAATLSNSPELMMPTAEANRARPTPEKLVGSTVEQIARNSVKEYRRSQREGTYATRTTLTDYNEAGNEVNLRVTKEAVSIKGGTAEYDVFVDMNRRKGKLVPSSVDRLSLIMRSYDFPSDEKGYPPADTPTDQHYSFIAERSGREWAIRTSYLGKDGSELVATMDTETEFNRRWAKSLGSQAINQSVHMLAGQPIGLIEPPKALFKTSLEEGGTLSSSIGYPESPQNY